MKFLRITCLGLLLVMVGLVPACRTTTLKVSNAQAVPPELTQLSYLHMVMRYLYRWQLDASEFDDLLAHDRLVYWIRPLNPKLDPGDNSKYVEIIFPQLDMSVVLKKANYTIAEVNEPVVSKSYKITRVTEGDTPKHQPKDCTVVTESTDELRDFLFTTRWQHDYFDPVVVQHLRDAVADEAEKEGLSATNVLNGQQLICIGPRSPAANETWVLWEIRRKLFYIASDIDLADPDAWKYQNLTIRVFDLEKQVVISHEEATGSNFYLTRSQVSRALFNCVILGQRIDVPSIPASSSPPRAMK